MAKEIRAATIEASEADAMTLVGHPVIYESPTTINLPDGGSYTEIIHRGALDGCDLHDVCLYYNHDDTAHVPLARTRRTMRLTVDDTGLHFVASLASDNPSAREVYSAIQRRDLTGLSFAFTVSDGTRYDAETNTRHIDRIDKILEVSICPHPAYPTTSVEARTEVETARSAAMAQARTRALRIQAQAQALRIINHQIGD